VKGVEISGVSKSFGPVEVLRNIDLAIRDGEFVALVGPSGCGKSTLLRLIAGLEDATEGEIVIDGRLANDLTPRERNIAMVFQSYALYPHMTVAENMGFNLKLAGVSGEAIKTRVAEAARMLDIGGLLQRKPAQLSGGQRQRVAMGRAIVRDPSVFLFDEPLSNLDAKLRVQMRAEIKILHQKVRKTTVYVTHDQIEAMTLADNIVVLNGGKIEQQGRPMDLYNRPANRFVAGFIGSPAMNFLDATIVDTSSGKTVSLRSGQQFSVDPKINVRSGQDVIVGLRPEHLGAGKGTEVLSGKVQLIEPAGAQTLLLIDVGGQTVTAVVDSEAVPGTLTSFEARFDRNRVHLFDAKTEQRIDGPGA
jgi:multiple sugar transport system ATP-binding protein